MATANLREDLLNMNKTSEAMMTAGVAPRWNQPRSFGGATGDWLMLASLGYFRTINRGQSPAALPNFCHDT